MAEATSPQVQLVVELTTRPGAQREMRVALDRLVAATRREDRGVVRFEVGLDPDDDRRVLGYEIWASQDALDEHSAKAHTREFKARARELVVDPAAPMRVARWQPMRAELPAPYGPGTPVLTPPAAPPPGFTSERRLVNDARVHYVTGGSGTPVVLLHGFPNNWYAWRDVMPRLAERHTVIAVDLRGLGDSDPGTRPNDVPTGADDLHGLVAELGLGPVLLAGQDWGGSTAFAFAAAHPDEVRRLAVLEAMPGARGPRRGQEAAVPGLPAFIRYRTFRSGWSPDGSAPISTGSSARSPRLPGCRRRRRLTSTSAATPARSSRTAGTMSQKSGQQSSPACCSASSTGGERPLRRRQFHRSGCRAPGRCQDPPHRRGENQEPDRGCKIIYTEWRQAHWYARGERRREKQGRHIFFATRTSISARLSGKHIRGKLTTGHLTTNRRPVSDPT
jgi:pimeloyl-ACP methyl ester carboxylesterase/quinol monooxygenase YgiN